MLKVEKIYLKRDDGLVRYLLVSNVLTGEHHVFRKDYICGDSFLDDEEYVVDYLSELNGADFSDSIPAAIHSFESAFKEHD